MADKPLTEKQEAFAVNFVITGNPAEAYRRAYDVESNATDGWIYVEAYQLLEHPRIAPRIAELHEQAKQANQFTVNKAMEELEDARALAHAEGQAGAAVSAVNSKIKLAGMDRPRRYEVSGPGGGPIQQEISPRDKLADAISRLSSRGAEDSSSTGADG